jgi:hypothetical protein
VSAPRRHGRLRQGLLLALLTGLAVLGNVWALPIFFGIQVLLGSIFPTLVLLWRRAWWNVPIAVLASLNTWKAWGHPWGILIFGTEPSGRRCSSIASAARAGTTSRAASSWPTLSSGCWSARRWC